MWKLACLSYCTIHIQQTSTGSTTGFAFVQVCWGKLSSSSSNHSILRLIAVAWKDQTWRWGEYIASRLECDTGDLILERPCIHGFSTKGEVLILFWCHDDMRSVWFLYRILLRKTLLFFMINYCQYKFQLSTGLC